MEGSQGNALSEGRRKRWTNILPSFSPMVRPREIPPARKGQVVSKHVSIIWFNLISFTKSVAIPWRESGHEVLSADVGPRFTPEICEDILKLCYCTLLCTDAIFIHPLPTKIRSAVLGAHLET